MGWSLLLSLCVALVAPTLVGGCGSTSGASEPEGPSEVSCRAVCAAAYEGCTSNKEDQCLASCLTKSASLVAEKLESCETRPEPTCTVGTCDCLAGIYADTDCPDSAGTTGSSITGEPPGMVPSGNLVFSLSVCDNFKAAVGPDATADSATKTRQLPDVDGMNPGRRIAAGEEGASIRCSVVESGNAFSLDLSISGTQTHPSETIVQSVGMILTDGRILKDAADGGSGEAFISLLTGGITYDSVGACTLSLVGPLTGDQFTVAPGEVFARFDCPNLSDPPTSGCVASGAFGFEGCAFE